MGTNKAFLTVGGERLIDRTVRIFKDIFQEVILVTNTPLDYLDQDCTITTDIIKRIMDSTFVIADITYPNTNVFYELGLRHACKPGTFIIRDKTAPSAPFDVSHLRRIEYENSPSGLKKLSEKFAYWFMHFDKNPHGAGLGWTPCRVHQIV